MVVHWDPFTDFARLQTAQRTSAKASESPRTLRPSVDIRETPEAFVFEADMPGIAPEAIQVEFEKGVLKIRGERAFKRDESSSDSYRRTERLFGVFERSFSLPNDVDGDAVTATFTHGVLEVHVPKKAEPAPKRITVKTA